MEKLDHFLCTYFYQIETKLNEDCKELSTIKFQSEEANTDEYLKQFFKGYLSKHNKLALTPSIDKVSIKRGEEVFSCAMNELKDFCIKSVWLPKDLTSEMKADIARSKRSVYTNPDLYLEISMPTKTEYVSVELKSTKKDSIPGSSVQQVSPYEWVIFVKHTAKTVNTACGFYVNAITEKLPFPDRSPRPKVGHKTLKGWNKKNRKVAGGTLVYTIDPEIEAAKNAILEDWEKYLCDEWLQTIARKKKGREKWFNNTIRIFSYELLKSVKDNPEKLNEMLSVLEENIK